MGDLASPRRRDVFERLRRRIENYRRHNNNCLNRFEPLSSGIYEHQRQETAILHQRWLESKAKRAAKNSKSRNTSNTVAVNSADTNPHSNTQITQQKLKRKLDTQPNPQQAAQGSDPNVDHYNFDDQQATSPPHKARCTSQSDTGNQSHCVSVNIVQQINTQSTDSHGKSEIKLTVQSTVHTNNQQPSTSTSISTVCKQEPVDSTNSASGDINAPSSVASSQASFPDNLGIDDDDELQKILDDLMRQEGEIPQDILKEFELDGSNNSSNSDSNTKSQKSPGVLTSGDSKKDNPTGMFADPIYEPGSLAANRPNSNSYNMGAQGASPMTAYARPPTGPGTAGPSPTGGPSPPIGAVPPIPRLNDTGPAAETLKQMAAQHQTHSQDCGAKPGMPSFSPEGYPDSFRRSFSTGGYTGYPGQNFMGNHGGMHPYNQMVSRSFSHDGTSSVKSENAINYGGTKPLSHFPEPTSMAPSASNLQQLQNTVQSHLSQGAPRPPSGPQMQISQTQHMQMNQGNQRLQLSQSQQMHISGATPQNISIAQQQSFNMGPGGANMPPQHQGQYMSEQMKMQMYHEKMRQQQQGGIPTQMQPYMGRPPPEYKVSPGMQSGYPQGNANSNPLQPMQNMVNQTSQSMTVPPASGNMYTTVKNEAGSVGTPTGGVPSQHSTPQTSSSPGTPTNMPQPPFSRSPVVSGQVAPPHMAEGSTMPNHPMKPSTPNYTSTFMRGNRPPNVNVGPDGLNISHQRPPDWPRGMMPHPSQQMRPHMPPGSMMQYGGYSNQTAMPGQHMQMHAAQMHAQQQRTMGMNSGGGPMGHPSQPSMMISQQQHVHIQNGQMGPSMGPGGGVRAPHPGGQSYSQTSNANNTGSDFPLDFLDNQQGGTSSDFFENQNPDFNFIDDILAGGGTK